MPGYIGTALGLIGATALLLLLRETACSPSLQLLIHRFDMRVLVIGASGLIGSHIVAEAMARGYVVLGTYCKHQQRGLERLDLNDIDELIRYS